MKLSIIGFLAITTSTVSAFSPSRSSSPRTSTILMGTGNTFGRVFRISTWGESHGGGVGVTLDGCPPRIPITRDEIQEDAYEWVVTFLDRFGNVPLISVDDHLTCS